MKIYSTQMLMTAGFLGELILNGITYWTYTFAATMFLTFLYNSISEWKEATHKDTETKK